MWKLIYVDYTYITIYIYKIMHYTLYYRDHKFLQVRARGSRRNAADRWCRGGHREVKKPKGNIRKWWKVDGEPVYTWRNITFGYPILIVGFFPMFCCLQPLDPRQKPRSGARSWRPDAHGWSCFFSSPWLTWEASQSALKEALKVSVHRLFCWWPGWNWLDCVKECDSHHKKHTNTEELSKMFQKIFVKVHKAIFDESIANSCSEKSINWSSWSWVSPNILILKTLTPEQP